MDMKKFDWDSFWDWFFTTVMAAAVGLTAAILIIALTCCTTTKYVEVPSTHTEYVTKIDSIILHDTIIKTNILKERVRDSSWLDSINGMLRINHLREIERIQDAASTSTTIQYIIMRDSAAKGDSIPVPYPVERELNSWEKTKINFGGWAMGIIALLALAAALWLLWRKFKNRITNK